jgi:hypothetical protein
VDVVVAEGAEVETKDGDFDRSQGDGIQNVETPC